MRTIQSTLFLLFISLNLVAQNPWMDISNNAITNLHEDNFNPLPSEYRVVNLDFAQLKNHLKNAPMEFTEAAKSNPLLLALPMPDGTMQNFEVAKSPMMEQRLADKFPEIKTFTLQGVDDPTAVGRMDFNASNFHAFLRSANDAFLIDPAGDHYISFYKKNKYVPKNARHECGFEHTGDNNILQAAPRTSSSVGEELRIYRIAVSTTGEYASYHGGTVTSVIDAIVTTINRINTVYEIDIAVRLVLIADNDQLVFLDADNDPFNNNSAGGMLNQNPTTINTIIGSENYDIGHVFATGGAGLAGLGVVCQNGKARGITGVFPPIGDFFDIDYVSHEIGHQFGASHTFNNCGGNESSGTAFEPGSGSTIMAYANLCGVNNVQFSSDPYFHGISLQNIFDFIDAGGVDCAETMPTNNTPPSVEIIEGGFNIPISTPFELTANGNDVDGDALTYCWEQFDTGTTSTLGSPMGNAPTFRTYLPTTSPTRVFPRIENVINNNLFTDVEYTPDYERGLTFNVVVRDNNAGAGGIAWDELHFDVTETAGPFEVLNPNTATTWEVGQWLEVNWDVANTDNNVVDCQRVNIKLSVDGGYTYPYLLTDNVPNNGSAFISVPNVLTDQARVRVEAADNIFFDISNTNFTIVPASQPGFSYFITPNFQETCLPANATIEIVTDSLLGYNDAVTYNITSSIPTGIITSFSANPALPSDGSVLTLDMSNYGFADTFDVTIQAIAMGLDTSYRTVTIRTIGNDFSDLAMETPADGTNGVPELQQFNWHSAQAADQYFVQIARSPTFDPSTIHDQIITTDTFFSPTTQLEISTPYYWRVRASNECGDQDFLATKSFHTLVFSCETYENNASETIPSTGQATIENKIIVPSGGSISDVNVSKIKGNHNNMNHLDVSLISPMETEVVLFANICLITTNFDFGLNDEAAQSIICPPNNGGQFLPQNPLSAFDNEPAEGEWILKTVVNNTAGSGGKISQFHLELCADVNLSSPYLVTNELMPIPPAQGRQITDEFLLVQDDNNTPMELEYTLVTAPEHGQIFFLGNEVNIGEIFRQSSLDAGNVIYVHNGDPNQFDSFTFTVNDGEGGFLGTPTFNIEIDPNAIVNVNELLQDDEIKIFPNPNNGNFNILFEKPVWKNLNLKIYNIHGQLILEKRLKQGAFNFEVQTPSIAAGIYFVKIETANEFLLKRMMIK
ncbi:MAG: reprolysin-like metallopeptidase [Saprospiraceae bacterium]